MKEKIFTAALLLAAVFSNAQSSAVTAGGEAVGSSGSSSHSIGLTVYKADVGENGSANNGMQHAYEIFEIDKPDISGNFQFSVYPNPTEDLVTVEIKDNTDASFSYQVFSITGKSLLSEKLNIETTTISMKDYPSGIYLIKIIHSDKTVKTFKIIKNQ